MVLEIVVGASGVGGKASVCVLQGKGFFCFLLHWGDSERQGKENEEV